jgi:hypothetical protein
LTAFAGDYSISGGASATKSYTNPEDSGVAANPLEFSTGVGMLNSKNSGSTSTVQTGVRAGVLGYQVIEITTCLPIL